MVFQVWSFHRSSVPNKQWSKSKFQWYYIRSRVVFINDIHQVEMLFQKKKMPVPESFLCFDLLQVNKLTCLNFYLGPCELETKQAIWMSATNHTIILLVSKLTLYTFVEVAFYVLSSSNLFFLPMSFYTIENLNLNKSDYWRLNREK